MNQSITSLHITEKVAQPASESLLSKVAQHTREMVLFDGSLYAVPADMSKFEYLKELRSTH